MVILCFYAVVLMSINVSDTNTRIHYVIHQYQTSPNTSIKNFIKLSIQTRGMTQPNRHLSIARCTHARITMPVTPLPLACFFGATTYLRRALVPASVRTRQGSVHQYDVEAVRHPRWYIHTSQRPGCAKPIDASLAFSVPLNHQCTIVYELESSSNAG
jgi:hypothetical protein